MQYTGNMLRLPYVDRWQTHPRLHGRQSVAEHSYRVAVLADALIDALAAVGAMLDDGVDLGRYRLAVLQAALQHDQAEARTGDTPAPTKRNKHLIRHYIAIEALIHPDLPDNRVRALVRVADQVEALIYRREQQAGESLQWQLENLEEVIAAQAPAIGVDAGILGGAAWAQIGNAEEYDRSDQGAVPDPAAL